MMELKWFNFPRTYGVILHTPPHSKVDERGRVGLSKPKKLVA